MGDKPNPSGATATAEQEAAATEAAAKAANAEALSMFGFKPAEQSGDKEKETTSKSDADKTEAKTTPGDPAKETTSKTGSEADGKGSEKPSEPTKFFGKYESIEAAELGYSNLVSHKTTIETENRELRKQLAEAKAKAETRKADAPKETTSRERYLADPEFKAAYEADVEVYGQAAADARLARDIKLFNLAESKPKSEPDPLLQELSQERLERQLVEKYPELKPEGKARKHFDALLARLKDEPSQDHWLDSLAKAALYEEVPDFVDSAYKRGRADVLKELKEKGIAATLVGDSAAPRSTEQAKVENDAKRDIMLKFVEPDHPLMRGL